MFHYFMVRGKTTFKILKSKQDNAWWTSEMGHRGKRDGQVIGKLGKLESIGHVEARVTVGTINRTVLSVAGNE